MRAAFAKQGHGEGETIAVFSESTANILNRELTGPPPLDAAPIVRSKCSLNRPEVLGVPGIPRGLETYTAPRVRDWRDFGITFDVARSSRMFQQEIC